jgi:hypothetical protein
MFEIVTLNGGSIHPLAVVMEIIRAVRANSAGGTVWFASCSRVAGRALWRVFATCIT